MLADAGDLAALDWLNKQWPPLSPEGATMRHVQVVRQQATETTAVALLPLLIISCIEGPEPIPGAAGGIQR